MNEFKPRAVKSSPGKFPVGQRPRILTFLQYYLPGFKSGGPIRTIANMVEHLGDELEFYIVTSGKDALDKKPYENVVGDSWNTVGKAMVFYASPKSKNLRFFAHLIRETPHDLIYLNSFFNPVFTLYPLLLRFFKLIPKRPIIIAPRGEFSIGALELKQWKKKMYILAMLNFGIYKNLLWQASSEYEVEDIRRTLRQKNLTICLAPDLPPAIDFSKNPKFEMKINKGPLRIVFLSRISKKKNLDYALSILSKCSDPVCFDIWGTIEDVKYWYTCQKLIKDMPPQIKVCYRGNANHDDVLNILSGYDLFFLPTRGENYGHVIAEALSAGTPVLISDQTPWRDLEAQGVGWDLPLDSEGEGFLKAISAAIKMLNDNQKEWRQRVFNYAASRLSDPNLIEANRSLFLTAIV